MVERRKRAAVADERAVPDGDAPSVLKAAADGDEDVLAEDTIKEAAALTGLPASTLRYYESIGVITRISRGASSTHRVYDEEDLDQLMWVACLAATGMSVSDMPQYVANGQLGVAAAGEQLQLLAEQERRLTLEAEHIALRQRYVRLKIDYWHAVQAGDNARVELSGSASGRAVGLWPTAHLHLVDDGRSGLGPKLGGRSAAIPLAHTALVRAVASHLRFRS
jgi:DNA-binding transcriptional MerR regulator